MSFSVQFLATHSRTSLFPSPYAEQSVPAPTAFCAMIQVIFFRAVPRHALQNFAVPEQKKKKQTNLVDYTSNSTRTVSSVVLDLSLRHLTSPRRPSLISSALFQLQPHTKT
ncbi:hypothetical protein, partial [Acinetobacter baumannii]|uniref:hypothetical protein n=1 Tax=Acinetobacter baumannii TaxID=470 RepID=UPI001C08FF12